MGLAQAGVLLRAEKTGLREIDVIVCPPGAQVGIGGDVLDEIARSEDVLPALYRRTPDRFPTANPAPGADPAAIAEMIRRELPDAVPAAEAQLDAVEQQLGVPLPAEVRAICLTAGHDEHPRLTAVIDGADKLAVIRTANALLTRCDRPLIEVFELR